MSPENKQWRIAVVSSGVHHVKRGIETWALDLATALHESGVNVTLFVGSGPASRPYERTVPCLHRGQSHNAWISKNAPSSLWRLGITSEYGLEQLSFTYRLLLGRHLTGFDLVHTQDPIIAEILDRYYRWGLLSTRTLLAHGTEEPPAYLQRFTYLQHLAPNHAEEILTCKKPGTQWFTVPNFVDTDTFAPRKDYAIRDELGIPRDAFVVLTSAAIKKNHKRIDYLIEEFAQFHQNHPDAHLLLAGASHRDTPSLEARANEVCPGNIHFLLDQPRSRMPSIYNAGTVFVLCSLKEMMPIALLEALASGLPCLVSEHAVVTWMIGEGGTSVCMSQQGALCSALETWRSSEKLENGRKQARDHALATFSKPAVLDDILQTYEEILS